MYYWKLDFWIPVTTLTLYYISLLSLAFPVPSRAAWLNLTPVAMWLCDAAENINHFIMARSYPDLAAFSLLVGPYFTFSKWMLILAMPPLAVMGFLGRRARVATTRTVMSR